MPRERKLSVRGEDAHVVAVVAHRRHERGLGERDLTSEREHHLRVETGRNVWHHAELVARERGVGEHVEQPERNTHGEEVSQRRGC